MPACGGKQEERNFMKITIVERIILTAVTVAVFVALVALAAVCINRWVMLAIGATVFIVGVIAQIIAGKKDNNTTLNIAILMVALGGMTTLISILTITGFFNGVIIQP